MINTQKHRDELQSWLEVMGTSSYAIFDKQTEIEIKENQKSDSFNVFLQKIQAVNKEISKGIVGQTMTMDDGSSQSQATVHLEIYDEITAADINDIQDWVTDDLFPILRNHGFDIPEGYYMQIVEQELINPAEKIHIDNVLLTHGFNIDPAYVEEFYGTPLDKNEPRKIFDDKQELSADSDFF
jgi:phage gp29-like protein